MIVKTDLSNGYVEIKSDKNVYIHGGFPEADYSTVIEPASVNREYIETDRPIPESPEQEPPQPKPVTNEDIMAQLEAVQAELEKAKKEQEATKSLMLDSMQGTADLYLVEQENKQLQLDAMQGIADLYAMQMGGGQ